MNIKFRKILKILRGEYAMLLIICALCALMLAFQECLMMFQTREKLGSDKTEESIAGENVINHVLALRNPYNPARREFQRSSASNGKKAKDYNNLYKLYSKANRMVESLEIEGKHHQPLPVGERVAADDEKAACPKHRIASKYGEQRFKKDIVELLCKPHESSLQDCLYAKKLYKIDEGLRKCKVPDSKMYCDVSYDFRDRNIKIRCNESNDCSLFVVHGLDNNTGGLKVLKSFFNVTEMEFGLLKIAKKAMQENLCFVFIYCVNDEGKRIGKQLVVLPSVQLEDKPLETNEASAAMTSPNINIVLLDSISRAHFYRSLPMLINKFNEINKKSDTEIIDFELFQSVHGHSAENFRALFTGKLYPKSMSDAVKEDQMIGANELLGSFKDSGYETMYQDDLCWKSFWGMRIELGSPKNWSFFIKEIKNSNIDTTGLTFSSCEILKANKLDTPFNGPQEKQICFNGRFQHSYIFQFLHQFHKETHLYKTKPKFSFTGINTAHDYTGLRIQTLNLDLSKFVEEMSVLPNTLTILLADHGNTYTRYTNAVMEGRYEMYHPSLFMIIPRGVADYLDADVMNSLRLNSKRLFTMIDLHASLKTIARRAKNKEVIGYQGILQMIPANRTCDDLNLRLPNLCVCEGWDTEVQNDTKQIGVLEFAVGTLNNMILKQQESQTEFTAKCNRLYPLYFLNVRERSSGEHSITTMDFKVKAGLGADQNEDIFHVEIQSTIDPEKDSMNMKLLSFDRLSQYGIYRRCQDERVDTRLCVCSLNVQQSKSPVKSSRIDLEKAKSSQPRHDTSNLRYIGKQDGNSIIKRILRLQPRFKNMPATLRIENVSEEDCVYLLKRIYFEVNDQGEINRKDYVAASVELLNVCHDTQFEISISVTVNNMRISGDIPVFTRIKGQQMIFLASFSKNVPYWKSAMNIMLQLNALNGILPKFI